MRASSFTRAASRTRITAFRKLLTSATWWEADTGLPVPLAGICARADLDPALVDAAERAIRASVAHAFAHPEASRAFVRAHAQEMSDEVCDAHIRLYVNELSLDVGDEGLKAIRRLVASASPGASEPAFPSQVP